jgi:acyl carrier protein
MVEAEVRALALRVLALDPKTAIDPREPLNALGLDSLMAVELRNAIGKLVDRTLPATLLFKYPTVVALTAYLATDVLGLANPDEAGLDGPSLDDPESAAVMDLDDEEAKRLLAEELAALSAEPWFDEQK